MNTICLDEKYSTTRLLTQDKPKIINNPDDKFESVLFLPEGKERKGEGGLRTKGYFKKFFEDKPLISIITVVYNGKEFLEETILSVVSQTYDNVEYIVIDGGSTDGTLDIIKKNEGMIDYWVSEKDNGISDAFNKGLIISQGNYIQILNCGDMLLENISTNKMLQMINYKQNFDVVAFQAKTDTDNIFPKYNLTEDLYINKNSIKICDEKAMVSHQATLVSLRAYKKVNLYDVSLKLRMDYDFFIRAQKNVDFICFNFPVIFYRTDGLSSALSNRLAFKLEEYKVLKKECIFGFFEKVKFFVILPVYLAKKVISFLYYKFK